MIIKTSELEHDALDWAVAKADGVRVEIYDDGFLHVNDWSREEDLLIWSPREDWSQGGPLIEQNIGTLKMLDSGGYSAIAYLAKPMSPPMIGDTALIACMRAFVYCELGETVDVPEELIK